MAFTSHSLTSIARTCLLVALLRFGQAETTPTPDSLTILDTRIRDCRVPITTSISPNRTSIVIAYDTTASQANSNYSDTLAWTDSSSASETRCLVCLRVKWGGGEGGTKRGEDGEGGVGGAGPEKRDGRGEGEGGEGEADGGLYGYITGLDYDYYHKLELGLLEQVWTKITRDGNSTDDEWFETSYIYGDDTTLLTTFAHVSLPNATEAMRLDYRKESEGICVETSFAVYNRQGVTGATGEISRKSVFTQGVNLRWDAA